MMRVNVENGTPYVEVEHKDRVGVYLDNDSLIELAKGPTNRRCRFVSALHRRGTLLFSFANALEVAGPQGASADAVRALLDSIGPQWIPVEVNPWKAIEREARGPLSGAAVSMDFVDAYFRERVHDSGENRLLDLSSESFFRLGAIVDWVHQKRDGVRQYANEIDKTLREYIGHLREAYERDARMLDTRLPCLPFDANRPATFVFVHLLRTLVIEAKSFQFKRNDGIDFCHAVMGAAYSNIATLDRQWKRRIDNLPKPNQLARMFFRPEVDKFVDLLSDLTSGTGSPPGPVG